MAQQILAEERELKRFYRSARLSLDRLDENLQRLPGCGFEIVPGAH